MLSSWYSLWLDLAAVWGTQRLDRKWDNGPPVSFPNLTWICLKHVEKVTYIFPGRGFNHLRKIHKSPLWAKPGSGAPGFLQDHVWQAEPKVKVDLRPARGKMRRMACQPSQWAPAEGCNQPSCVVSSTLEEVTHLDLMVAMFFSYVFRCPCWYPFGLQLSAIICCA